MSGFLHQLLETCPKAELWYEESCLLPQVAVLLLRSGFASEWAAISAEHIRSGEVDIVARQLAGLVRTGRPFLAAEAAAALAHTASAKVVRSQHLMGAVVSACWMTTRSYLVDFSYRHVMQTPACSASRASDCVYVPHLYFLVQNVRTV